MRESSNRVRTNWNSFLPQVIQIVVLALAMLVGVRGLVFGEDVSTTTSDVSEVASPTAAPTIDSIPPAPSSTSDTVPPSPDANEPSDTPRTSTAEKPNLSLDALLDLADKDPDKLQSVNVQPAPVGDRLITPEQVFRPELSSGTASNSTGELLTRALGVVTRSTSVLNQDARLRGYSGTQIVGTADGMNQARTRIDVDSLFSEIDPNVVDSIVVIPGPYVAEFGPGFAFFNAQTTAPKRSDQFMSDSQTRVSYNSNGQQLMWREAASFSDRESGAFVSVGQRMGGEYSPGAHSNDFNVPAGFHEQDIFASVSNNFTERSRIDGTYLHQQIWDTQLPGVIYDISNQNADQFNLRYAWKDDFTGKDRIQVQSWYNDAAYQGNASSGSKQVTIFQQMIVQSIPVLGAGSTDNINGQVTNTGARANLVWGDDEVWQVKSGVDWRRAGQIHREMLETSNGSNPVPNNIFGIPESSSNDYGIFLSGVAKLTDRWNVTAGQRIDAVTYGVNTDDPVALSVTATPNNQSITGFNTPTRMLEMTYLTSNYRLRDDLTVNAGTAFAMRPPNLQEMYTNSASAPLVRFGNSIAYGNSDLAAEKNLQFDLGLTRKLENATFGVRGYHSDIHDYIGLGADNGGYFPQVGTTPNGTLQRALPYMLNPNPLVPNQNLSADTAALGYVYRNIDRVSIEGFEMLGEQRVQPWLEFVETLAYTRATNYDPTWTDLTTGQVHNLGWKEGLPGIYPMNGTATLRLVEPLKRKWTAEWQSRFARQQDYLATSLGEIGTPGFIVHNINTSYRWSDHVAMRASILNVLNLDYYEHTSLAILDKNGNVTFVKDPGISFFMSLECAF